MRNPIANVLFLYCVGVIISTVYGGNYNTLQLYLTALLNLLDVLPAISFFHNINDLYFEGIWTEDQDIEYVNGEGSRVFENPKKGSTFTISSTDFGLGKAMTYCTVEEVFLQKTLHFSNPEDSTHPDVLQ